MGLGKSLNPLIETLVDVLCSIVYLGGVAMVELMIRPLFSRTGKPVPLLANVILTVMELTMLASFISDFLLAIYRVVRSSDRLFDQIANAVDHITKYMERWSEYRRQRRASPPQQEEEHYRREGK